ncbi:MAG TPA: hypothetical protein VN598_10420 [Usitatibacter sp.]|nr:hypothetical protein [Usitatibacter sp.]
MQPDDEVTKRYRGLAREEPGAAMDAAILAASRRALRAPASRRWGAPVSIAAVLVLTFGLTLEMRHEEPGIESSMPARPAAVPEPSSTPATQPPIAAPTPDHFTPPAKDSAASSALQGAAPMKERALPLPKAVARTRKLEEPAAPAAEEVKRVAPQEAPMELRAAPPAERERPAPFPAPAAPPAAPAASIAAPVTVAPPPSAGAAPQRAPQMNAAPAYSPRAKAQSDATQRVESDPVTRELERIAGLRAEGRDAEADKALEAFRRDHPDYRIPEAMWERVKPR